MKIASIVENSLGFKRLYGILKKIDYSSHDEIFSKIEQFHAYMKGILKRNEFVNLTNIVNEEEFILKHYIDSISPMFLNEFKFASKIVDVGTGGGFPGVPLAIIYPEKEFVLIDSLKKRINVIRELCEEIGILNIKAYHGRAEDLAHDANFREKFDVVLSRAVSSLPTLLEVTIPFIINGGVFLAHKGPKGIDELSQCDNAMRELNCQYLGFEKEVVQDDSEHIVMKFLKINNTPLKYPRKAGIPKKKPL